MTGGAPPPRLHKKQITKCHRSKLKLEANDSSQGFADSEAGVRSIHEYTSVKNVQCCCQEQWQ